MRDAAKGGADEAAVSGGMGQSVGGDGMSEKEFPRGLYWNAPSPNAPTWVVGSLSINKEQFLGWLEKQAPNEKGYVRLNVKIGKEGKPYVELDTWKPRSEPKDDGAAYRAAKEGRYVPAGGGDFDDGPPF